jgi:5'-methylthioadenosine phosphorylase
MQTGVIGIIGGSGFYNMAGISDVRSVEVDTPFGKTSDPVVMGKLEGREIAFIARHGKGHRLSPTNVPARANVFALKTLGVTHLLSISAVGSMREEIEPLHVVLPDQIIDRTVHRPRTFFDDGPVVHVEFSYPYDPDFRDLLYHAARKAGAVVHRGGTYICIEGPQFSTLAESMLYRSWGVAVIGMTAMPEARLAREAEMCYATLAMATDYDSWHPDHDTVTVDLVVRNLSKNVQLARDVVANLVATMPDAYESPSATALKSAIMTPPDLIDTDVKERLKPLLGKYV